MLVKFNSSTSGEVMMFAESARVILGILGKECTAKGVITLEQLPDEIARLRVAISRDQKQTQASETSDAASELPVGFVQRATPFIEMLERTLKKEGYVLWEAPADFSGNATA